MQIASVVATLVDWTDSGFIFVRAIDCDGRRFISRGPDGRGFRTIPAAEDYAQRVEREGAFISVHG